MNAATTRQQGSVGKEHEALSRLIVRLKGQFPYLPTGHIEGLVHSHHAEFNDSPVREFVPNLRRTRGTGDAGRPDARHLSRSTAATTPDKAIHPLRDTSR